MVFMRKIKRSRRIIPDRPVEGSSTLDSNIGPVIKSGDELRTSKTCFGNGRITPGHEN